MSVEEKYNLNYITLLEENGYTADSNKIYRKDFYVIGNTISVRFHLIVDHPNSLLFNNNVYDIEYITNYNGQKHSIHINRVFTFEHLEYLVKKIDNEYLKNMFTPSCSKNKI